MWNTKGWLFELVILSTPYPRVTGNEWIIKQVEYSYVPAGIEDDTARRRDEVDAETACAGGDEEETQRGIRVELVDESFALTARSAAIETCKLKHKNFLSL